MKNGEINITESENNLVNGSKKIRIAAILFFIDAFIAALPLLVMTYAAFAVTGEFILFKFFVSDSLASAALIALFVLPLITGIYLLRRKRWAIWLGRLQAVILIVYGVYVVFQGSSFLGWGSVVMGAVILWLLWNKKKLKTERV